MLKPKTISGQPVTIDDFVTLINQNTIPVSQIDDRPNTIWMFIHKAITSSEQLLNIINAGDTTVFKVATTNPLAKRLSIQTTVNCFDTNYLALPLTGDADYFKTIQRLMTDQFFEAINLPVDQVQKDFNASPIQYDIIASLLNDNRIINELWLQSIESYLDEKIPYTINKITQSLSKYEIIDTIDIIEPTVKFMQTITGGISQND